MDNEIDRLHARAERSATEAQKTMLSLSSGGVAVFFTALTGQKADKLKFEEKLCVCTGALLFSAAVIAIMILWRADAQRAYFRGRMLTAKDDANRSRFKGLYDARHRTRGTAAKAYPFLFGVGMMTASAFTIIRTIS